MPLSNTVAVGHILHLQNNTNRSWWLDPGLRKLTFFTAVGMLGMINYGFDGSLINGFLSMPPFYESIGNPGAKLLGLQIAAYSLGGIPAFIPASYMADRWGRKPTILVGALIVLAGTLLQAFLIGGLRFLGARILLGFGVSFQTVAAPAWVVETAHPRMRARAIALLACAYGLGAIIAAWVCFGTVNITNDWCWRIPCIMQAGPPILQLVALPWMPESPRYLMSVGRPAQALEMLRRYHANGIEADELVEFEYREIMEVLEIERKTAKQSYAAFFRTKGNRHRLFLLILIGFMSQWVGNGIISYYLTPILEQVGITSFVQQTGINGGLSIWSFLVGIIGALLSDRLGTRFFWMLSAVLMLVFYVGITVCSAMYAKHQSAGSGYCSILFIFLYNGAYAGGFGFLAQSYPTELVQFDLRTKGAAVLNLAVNAAVFFNQYVNPLALDALAWKYFIVYDVILVVSVVLIYLCFPETHKRTLEEIAEVFDGPAALASIVAEVGSDESADQGVLGKDDIKDTDMAVHVLPA